MSLQNTIDSLNSGNVIRVEGIIPTHRLIIRIHDCALNRRMGQSQRMPKLVNGYGKKTQFWTYLQQNVMLLNQYFVKFKFQTNFGWLRQRPTVPRHRNGHHHRFRYREKKRVPIWLKSRYQDIGALLIDSLYIYQKRSFAVEGIAIIVVTSVRMNKKKRKTIIRFLYLSTRLTGLSK